MKLFRTPENRREWTAAVILSALILANLLFIFTNSMASVKDSGEASGFLAEIIKSIFPDGSAIGAFLSDNLRKIAHFVEFASLGLLVSLYTVIFSVNRKKTAPLSLVFGHFVAFFDETIQIFSGRGPMISDVWLDFSGFLTLTLITHTAAYLIRLHSER